MDYKQTPIIFAALVLSVLLLNACGKSPETTSSWCVGNEQAPSGEGIYQGIDVSHFQGEVKWATVKTAGVHFAFAKATQSNKYVDPKFADNWASIKEAGIVRGAYHFFKPGVDALAQAKHYIATVKLEPGDLPPVLDIEVTDGVAAAGIDAEIKIWLEAVSKAYGVKPIIYSDPAFINKNLSKGFENYPLWLARYSKSVPKAPAEWTAWNFWQCTASGKVDGVSAAVDKSIYQGSESYWASLLSR